jgi:putative membrane protein insertion efficiency factor
MPSDSDEGSTDTAGAEPPEKKKEAGKGSPQPKGRLWPLIRKAFLLLLILVLLDGLRAPGHQIVTRVMAAAIGVYQKYIAEDILKRNNITICRYTPTCSEYTKQALLKYGLYRGSVMGAWRIMRCNPMSPGGVDEP